MSHLDLLQKYNEKVFIRMSIKKKVWTNIGALVMSVLVHFSLYKTLDYYGYIPKKFSVNGMGSLPMDYMDGTLVWYKGSPRVRSSGIHVVDENSVRHYFECKQVDWSRYPDAVPCSRDAFSTINGRFGRIWYFKKKEKLIWGEGESRLAVQIEIGDGRLYSFENFKAAALDAQGKEDIENIIINMVLHGMLFLFVLFFIVRKLILKIIKNDE